ncbi:MFS transporter [Bartonella sp. M0280]|uniref:MFS transporter n=1 Tax=Bartonella apihabitans TaxID=2750929 RepID=UPI0018DD089E|nr:MFS transporter [Bartonella apihabitans]MBI0167547.1 MFS transporter [Bartonella apihabitans]
MDAAVKAPEKSHTITKGDVAAVAVGNAVEFYDFIVYTTFAVMIGKTFFPSDNEFVSLMSSVSTFGIGFIARPLGAILIGTYADKVGRKPAMILTMLLMAIGTAGLILLPGYEQIGIAAPILLVIARLAQGLAWGGEAGPATTFIMEAAPEGKRAFYASWQIVAQGAAAITAGLVGYILSLYLTHQQQTDWGWRIAFGLGLCILPIAILMRRHLGETLKLEDKAENNSTKGLLKEIFEHYSALIFIGIFVLSGSTVTQYFLNYTTTYALTELHYGENFAMLATFVVGLGVVIFALIGGYCADRFGRRITIVAPRIILLVILWPGLYLVNQFNSIWVFFGVITIFTALQNISGAGIVIFLCECFPKRLRATGFSISYALGISLFGGTAQIVVTWILELTGNPASPAFYLIFTNILCLGAVFLSRNKKVH